MTRFRIDAYTVSLDGFGAGPDQTLSSPMGEGTAALHNWLRNTRTFQAIIGRDGGTSGDDDRIAAQGFENIGAWIMGRNMYTHERGPWSDPDWQGWWGDVPPYHCDVFVLTHHDKPSLTVADTTFHFVTGGIHAAATAARDAAGGKDVRVGGGAETIRAFLTAGLIDEAHIAVSPIILGRGEPSWAGLDLPAIGYRLASTLTTPEATHLKLTRG